MKRKLAEHDNLKITIEQTGDKFHIKESSTFRTKDIDFTLGVPFDYSLADGTEVTVSALKCFRHYYTNSRSWSRCCFVISTQQEMVCFRKICFIF